MTVRDSYDPVRFDAERYTEDNLRFWTPLLVELPGIEARHRVLDLGCGTGGFSWSLAEVSGARVTGVDSSAALLMHAADVRVHRDVTWVRGLADALPFPDGSFQRVIASLIVHQLDDRPRVFREVSGRAGGRDQPDARRGGRGRTVDRSPAFDVRLCDEVEAPGRFRARGLGAGSQPPGGQYVRRAWSNASVW